MTILSRQKAVEKALKQTTNVPGTCQLATRQWYNAPSVGDVDKDGDADAVDGWKSEPANAKRFDRFPPRGYPVAFGGGSKGYGHRAISLGNGMIRSTDMENGRYKKGVVGNATIWEIEASMGVHYLGWSTTISGFAIPDDSEPLPPGGGTVNPKRPKFVRRALKNIRKQLATNPGPDQTERLNRAKDALLEIKKR